ncbi:fetuin-B [Microcaecilia unicolor]|uniref:Fetuin-B-like n=1 Tax=Microcaecilia unicolor TaxID=1415580 RepID=A0A6P7Z8X7_9AMPH|nr:fetuin-B-like [Microcaecilia unicolor]
MKLLLLLACIQLCRSVPPSTELPEPVLQDASCNDTLVKVAAGLALDEINSKRTEGYVFNLNRIADAHTQRVGTTGTVFYLQLDLVETKCHVLSKRRAKDCENRPLHQSVYGHCNATYYLNRPGRIARLYSYDCAFHPVSREKINMMCPDCPIASSPDTPIFLETAEKTLQKFNQESNETHYFTILNVTKASMQWVVGPSHFVEYTIYETICIRVHLVVKMYLCERVERQFARLGLCQGSVMKSDIMEHTSVSCEIYEPEKHQEPGDNQQQKEDDDDHKHHHDKKGDKRHGHHHHHHHGKHQGRSHNHKHPNPTNDPHAQLVDPTGSSKIDIFISSPPSESVSPGTADVVKPMPLPFFPPFLVEPTILPFPEKHSEADQCPGEYVVREPLL